MVKFKVVFLLLCMVTIVTASKMDEMFKRENPGGTSPELQRAHLPTRIIRTDSLPSKLDPSENAAQEDGTQTLSDRVDQLTEELRQGRDKAPGGDSGHSGGDEQSDGYKDDGGGRHRRDIDDKGVISLKDGGHKVEHDGGYRGGFSVGGRHRRDVGEGDSIRRRRLWLGGGRFGSRTGRRRRAVTDGDSRTGAEGRWSFWTWFKI